MSVTIIMRSSFVFLSAMDGLKWAWNTVTLLRERVLAGKASYANGVLLRDSGPGLDFGVGGWLCVCGGVSVGGCASGCIGGRVRARVGG